MRVGFARTVRAVIASTLLAAIVCTPVTFADDVADFLEQHSLKSLLARHLEQLIQQQKPEDRNELVLQLASVYAELLEKTVEPQQREDIEARSRALLEMAPTAGSEELRLALLRTTYRVAERIAERHRVRMATEEEIAAAKQSLSQINLEFGPLRQRLKHAIELADRRLSRAAGSQATQISEAGEHARSLYSQCTFLYAWSLYYQSWLNDRDAEARTAEPLFAELLMTESELPEPSDVSVDLRANEAVARAILGMGLCKSLTATSATAISWIALLNHENTHDSLRAAADGWKIAVHLEHGEFQKTLDLMDSLADGGVSTAWLRLIAAWSLEDATGNRIARNLAQRAVLSLANQGELTQVLDLANRFGADALGTSGFALQYVRGVILYQEARSAHGDEKPTFDAPIQSLYQKAADQLNAALAEPDAIGNAEASASCRRLAAWCLYFRGEFLAAADAFERAAAHLAGDDAAEAMWMAIVALNHVAEAGSDPSLRSRLDQVSAAFIAQYPASEHAATLRLRRSLTSSEVSETAAEELLAIAPNSDHYEVARRRAADMLYQLFRSTGASERHYRAGRFLQTAMPLLAEESREWDFAAGEAGAEQFLVRCRQVLEVALADGIDRADAARAALDALVAVQQAHNTDLSSIASEMMCRTVQERLLSRDEKTAAELANQLWDAEPNSVWTRLATRAMFRIGHSLWKNPDATVAAQREGLELTARFGGRVLREFQGADDALEQPGALGYHVAVAEATFALWEMHGDEDRGKAALYLYERLLKARPRNAAFLRSTAILAERVGDSSRALECWRSLIAGSDPATEAWFEARFNLIRLLAKNDPIRAREVMQQHKQLNPEYGPPPWGALLKGLDELLSSQNEEPNDAASNESEP